MNGVKSKQMSNKQKKQVNNIHTLSELTCPELEIGKSIVSTQPCAFLRKPLFSGIAKTSRFKLYTFRKNQQVKSSVENYRL